MKALVCACLLAFAGLPARAAPVDMNTLTCQDWLDAGEDEQDLMIAWLRGFLAGHATGAMYNADALRADATTFKVYCQKHTSVSLVSAASQWKR